MPRALWKGAISFGLVNIPIELYSAVKRNELDFTMLDRRNMTPVGYQKINKETGKEVPWEEIVKAYEYEEGRYVVLSEEDFRLANVKATQTVDIISFVDAGDIPFSYFDTPYYLAPGKRGEKGYALLRESLKKAGKVAIAYVVIRNRQQLAALVPSELMLMMNTLRYADEIRPLDEFELPEDNLKTAGVSPKEIGMALRLVEEMTEEWAPEEYRDTYRDDILARVEKKIKAGKTKEILEPESEKKERKGAEIVDLMALLKRSVDASTKGSPANGAGRREVSGRKAGASKGKTKIARKRAATSRTHRAA